MNLKSIAKLSCLASCLVLVGCKWFDDDNKTTTTQTALTGKIELVANHAYVAGGDDDYNDIITSTNITTGKKVSVLLTVDENSKVVGRGATNGFIEVELNLNFNLPAGGGSQDGYRATMRLLKDGPDSMVAQHRLRKLGDAWSSERVPVTTIDWHKPTTLTIEWKEADQKFTFSANSNSWDIHVSDFLNNLTSTVDGFAFTPANFENLSLITTVRNMDVAGESGYMKAVIDKVTVDDVVYDDFDRSNSLDQTKWKRESFSF